MTINFNRQVRLMGSWSSSHAENRQCLEWMADGTLDGAPLMSDVIDLDELPRVYTERIDPGKAVKLLVKVGEEF
jgi:threonine dehydrogenase-like Zn-dependent dehydrogenase